MPTPIVVAGRNRSGTKWLSNVIASHSQVVCAQNPRHRGLIECNVLVEAATIFGSLRHWENRVAFLESFAASDFFHATGLEREVLYAERDAEYSGLLRRVMDTWASRAGVRYWALKVDTASLRGVLEAWPDARAVGIVRDSVDTARSALALARRKGEPDPSLEVLASSWLVAQKRLEACSGNPRVRIVTYEDLRTHRAAVVASVCELLGLEPEPAMFVDSWQPNTSFTEVARDDVLSPVARLRLQVALRALDTLSLPALEALIAARDRVLGPPFLRDGRRRFVEGSYGDLREDQGR